MIIRASIIILCALLLLTLVQRAFQQHERIHVLDANGNDVTIRYRVPR